MKIARTIEEVRQQISLAKSQGKKIGLVPTMGALHEGHASLFDSARKKLGENGFVIASIFVNPTQFGPGEDFEAYPRTETEDLATCESHSVDLAFLPAVEAMYPEGAKTVVSVREITRHMCGKSRPGHFDGVATIVAKLFNIATPDFAFFGEKDFQQIAVVSQMARDLDMPVEIVPCPTIREEDGLAKSSRNKYLDPEQRVQASALFRALMFAQDLAATGDSVGEILDGMEFLIKNNAPHGEIDYLHIVDSQTLDDLPHDVKPSELNTPTRAIISVYFGKARLIDNMQIFPAK